MHYTNILAKNKMFYKNILQLAENNTCTTKISQLQGIKLALHKYLTAEIIHALHKYLTVARIKQNKTYSALHKYLTVSNRIKLTVHYTNILQLAENKTCTTQISYSQQRIKHALHKYLKRIKHALQNYLTISKE